MANLTQFCEKLNMFSNYAIICHVRPDGDAVGSALALKLGLNSLGKNADIFCEDEIPEKFFFIEGMSEFSVFPNKEYDAVISVDCADEGRIGTLFEFYKKHKFTFNIDHHVSNTKYAKENLVIDSASNCENIYAVLKELNAKIDTKIANALLLGISTDSGQFSHQNLTSSPFLVAADLVDNGADINKIYYENYKRKSKQKAKLFSLVCSNIKYDLDDRLAFAIISEKTIADCLANSDDTEGIIDFVLSIDCVEVAVSVMEFGQNRYKISFRSKGVNVNEIASRFGGGGHVLASGCMINGSLYDVLDKITCTVKQFLA